MKSSETIKHCYGNTMVRRSDCAVERSRVVTKHKQQGRAVVQKNQGLRCGIANARMRLGVKAPRCECT